MKTTRPEKNHLHPLTSLRFLAAALIVVMHAEEVFGSAYINPNFPLWQGVSFFFVLSGFILAYNYPVLGSRREVLLFYTARFARVWPVHIVTLLILIAFMYFRGQLTMPHIGWYVAVNALLLQSWIPLSKFNHSFNAVSWSLSVEFFFYLLFPLLILDLKKTWITKFVAGLFLIVVLICVSNYYIIPVMDADTWQITLPGLLAANPLARVFEFMLGILACSIYRTSHCLFKLSCLHATIMEIITLLLVPLFMMLSVSIQKPESIYNWMGVGGRYYLAGSGSAFIFAYAIFVFAVGRGYISRILSYSFAVRLGEISFSLYLVHTIVLHNFAIDREIDAHPLLWYLTYWAVCLAMAYALFIGIEQPVRVIILSLAKRYIKSESRSALPPILSVTKPMLMGGGIMLRDLCTNPVKIS